VEILKLITNITTEKTQSEFCSKVTTHTLLYDIKLTYKVLPHL